MSGLRHGEHITAANIQALQPGDQVKRVNLIRTVESIVGRYEIRLRGEERFWNVRAPLLKVTFFSGIESPAP